MYNQLIIIEAIEAFKLIYKPHVVLAVIYVYYDWE